MEWLWSQLDASSVTAAVAAVVGMIYASSDGRFKMVVGWLKNLLPASKSAPDPVVTGLQFDHESSGDPPDEFKVTQAIYTLHRLAPTKEAHSLISQYERHYWDQKIEGPQPSTESTK